MFLQFIGRTTSRNKAFTLVDINSSDVGPNTCAPEQSSFVDYAKAALVIFLLFYDLNIRATDQPADT